MKKLLIPLLCFLPFVIFAQDYELGLPIGHSSHILSSRTVQNDQLLVTASNDGQIGIWDIKTQRLLHLLNHFYDKEKSGFQELKFDLSSDGKKIITWVVDDYYLELWDIETGKLEFQIDLETNYEESKNNSLSDYEEPKITSILDLSLEDDESILLAKFSQNGKQIIIINDAGEISFWNVKNGKKKKTHQLNTSLEDFHSVRISPNNKYLILVDNSLAEIWSFKKRKLVKILEGNFELTIPKFNFQENYLAFQTEQNTVQIFDLNSKSIINDINTDFNDKDHDEKFIEFSPDGKYLAIASSDSEMFKIWNLDTSKIKFICDEHMYNIDLIKFSNNSKYIASGSDQIIVWRLDEEEFSWQTFNKGNNFRIENIVFSKDDKSVIASLRDNSTKVWSLENQNEFKTFKNNNYTIKSIEPFLENNKIVLGANKYVTIGNVGTGLLEEVFEHDFLVRNAELIKSEKKLLVTTEEYLNFWDLNTNTKERRFRSNLNSNIKMENSIFLDGKSEDYSKDFPDSDDRVYIRFSDGNSTLWNLINNEERWSNFYDPKYIRSTYFYNIREGDIIELYRKKEDSWNFDETDYQLLQTFYGDKCILNEEQERVAIINGKRLLIWNIKTKSEDVYLDENSSDIENAIFTNDGNNIITLSKDGNMSYWDLKTSEKLVTLNIIEGNKYLWILPDNYYFASKEAAQSLFFKNGLQTIGFEQLDVKYNRPDKILKVLGDITGADNSKMINAYKKAWEKRIRKLDIDTTSFRQGFSVPESEFYNRDNIAYEQSKSELKLRIKGSDNTYKLDRFNVWVNEVPIYGRKGISLKSRNIKSLDTTIILELSQGENRIETSILNVNGIESYRQPLYVNYTPKKEIKEKLYFVGIGVDKYQEEGNDLNYSVKDIKDLSIQLKEKYGSLIQIDTLFNQNVTVSNIKKLKEQLKKSKVDDKVIISFSGHGLLSKDLDYYLAMHDVNFDSPEENGLPYEDLENLLDGIPSRQKLLLIDACHSGEVDKEEVESIHKVEKLKEGLKGSIGITTKKPKLGIKNSFELMKELFNNVDRATGATVISAAAGTEFAQERGNLKNGVFTYCILNQLKEKETISVSELKQLVSEQVKEITNGLQQPTSRNETIENDWKVW